MVPRLHHGRSFGPGPLSDDSQRHTVDRTARQSDRRLCRAARAGRSDRNTDLHLPRGRGAPDPACLHQLSLGRSAGRQLRPGQLARVARTGLGPRAQRATWGPDLQAVDRARSGGTRRSSRGDRAPVAATLGGRGAAGLLQLGVSPARLALPGRSRRTDLPRRTAARVGLGPHPLRGLPRRGPRRFAHRCGLRLLSPRRGERVRHLSRRRRHLRRAGTGSRLGDRPTAGTGRGSARGPRPGRRGAGGLLRLSPGPGHGRRAGPPFRRRTRDDRAAAPSGRPRRRPSDISSAGCCSTRGPSCPAT